LGQKKITSVFTPPKGMIPIIQAILLIPILLYGVYWVYLKLSSKYAHKKSLPKKIKTRYSEYSPISKAMRLESIGTTHLKRNLNLIPASQILSKYPNGIQMFCDELKSRSYACIKVDVPEIKNASDRLTEVGLEYLNQELQIKERNIDPASGNVGYVNIPEIREYIKLRLKDPDHLWPQYPDNFKDIFYEFHKQYTKIAKNCFVFLSESVNAEEPHSKRLIRQDDTEAISEVIEERSSLSMIKYYPVEKTTEVCDEHTDTGILTFITRTHRPSLEIWDRSENEYIQIEELLDRGDIVVFVSEKVPLFSGSMDFRPAFHRVRMPAGPVRLSIAYLLDVCL
jgi:hypothetical protein